MRRNVVVKDFYLKDDVLQLSRDLLGKFLCTYIEGVLTSGMIVETEAYRGPEDKASHAWNGRRTRRNEAMYAEGGVSYVYSCYGMHSLFNVVTNQEGIPHAVLVRALQPCQGLELMAARRGMSSDKHELTNGPAKLTQALGITTAHNGMQLQGPVLWIEDRGAVVSEIIETTRIGIHYAGEHALLPWRYYIKDSKWVSKKNL